LETHIPNSYTNSLLQVIHYSRPIRLLAKSHITTDCPEEHCLLCELGFVARMLEEARGTNCHSSNFCKTLVFIAQSECSRYKFRQRKVTVLSATNMIELIDYGRQQSETDYSHMVQLCHRFLIDNFSSEGNSFPNNPVLLIRASTHSASPPVASPITQLMGINMTNTIICLNCKTVRQKENMIHVVDMIYPPTV
jgi:PAB-dependent poly(A)-specific ribonuclease subunit 2